MVEEERKMSKRQVTATIDEELVEEMERVRKETGVPVSTQIVLGLRGYKIAKIRGGKVNGKGM